MASLVIGDAGRQGGRSRCCSLAAMRCAAFRVSSVPRLQGPASRALGRSHWRVPGKGGSVTFCTESGESFNCTHAKWSSNAPQCCSHVCLLPWLGVPPRVDPPPCNTPGCPGGTPRLLASSLHRSCTPRPSFGRPRVLWLSQFLAQYFLLPAFWDYFSFFSFWSRVHVPTTGQEETNFLVLQNSHKFVLYCSCHPHAGRARSNAM